MGFPTFRFSQRPPQAPGTETHTRDIWTVSPRFAPPRNGSPAGTKRVAQQTEPVAMAPKRKAAAAPEAAAAAGKKARPGGASGAGKGGGRPTNAEALARTSDGGCDLAGPIDRRNVWRPHADGRQAAGAVHSRPEEMELQRDRRRGKRAAEAAAQWPVMYMLDDPPRRCKLLAVGCDATKETYYADHGVAATQRRGEHAGVHLGTQRVQG